MSKGEEAVDMGLDQILTDDNITVIWVNIWNREAHGLLG
jgi:hypothetical protein